jgi:hypothetical protein
LNDNQTRRRVLTPGVVGITLIFLLVAWIGCYFPWIATTGTAFSVNLFDLAEWTSLDPNVRGGNPPLLATFLLRATVGLIAVALATKSIGISNRVARWGLWILAALIGAGLLPPLDFFRGAFDDLNYRQQFVIALISVMGTCVVIFIEGRTISASMKLREKLGVRFLLGSGLAILGLATGMIGAVLGIRELSAFGLHLAPGLGLILTGLALVGAISLSLVNNITGLRRYS